MRGEDDGDEEDEADVAEVAGGLELELDLDKEPDLVSVECPLTLSGVGSGRGLGRERPVRVLLVHVVSDALVGDPLPTERSAATPPETSRRVSRGPPRPLD